MHFILNVFSSYSDYKNKTNQSFSENLVILEKLVRAAMKIFRAEDDAYLVYLSHN